MTTIIETILKALVVVVTASPYIVIGLIIWWYTSAKKDATEMMSQGSFWKNFLANVLTGPAALLWMLATLATLFLVIFVAPVLWVATVSVVKTIGTIQFASWDQIKPIAITMPSWVTDFFLNPQ